MSTHEGVAHGVLLAFETFTGPDCYCSISHLTDSEGIGGFDRPNTPAGKTAVLSLSFTLLLILAGMT